MAKSESLSNSAAPQNPQAWPPISRHRTCCSAIEERTPGIGFRIKDASKRDVSLPEPGTLLSPLQRTHPVPLRPFFAEKFFSARFERPFLHVVISRCLQQKAHPVYQTAATRHFGGTRCGHRPKHAATVGVRSGVSSRKTWGSKTAGSSSPCAEREATEISISRAAEKSRPPPLARTILDRFSSATSARSAKAPWTVIS